MARTIRRILLFVIVAVIVAAIGWALWPGAVPVEAATVSKGLLRVTVDEDGKTRIKQRYLVSAPLAGRLDRILLKEGDRVVAGETLIASIEAPDPTLLDPRARAEAEARVKMAEAAVDKAAATVDHAQVEHELAEKELKQFKEAGESHAANAREIDRAESAANMTSHALKAAEFAREMAKFELAQAKAALTPTDGKSGPDGAQWRFDVKSPINGRVLRQLKESAAVVTAGTPLVEVGDPTDIELVVDVLSSDGVPIRPGASASLEHWGGDAPLAGRVRLVEPAAFTKISALGVEEQRVNVIIDFVDPPAARAGLGDNFHIDARITTWEDPSVLKVPAGALFRHASSWAVYRIADGRVSVQDVKVGRRSGTEAQILSGLNDGDAVVLYPSDRVHDGVRVAPARTAR